MAWEKRRGKRYYYRATRRNGRVVKQYMGRGLAAKRAFDDDQLKAAYRKLEQERTRQFKKQLWSIDARMRLIRDGCRLALQATYLAAGYHQTRSLNWKRKKESTSMTERKDEAKESSTEGAGQGLPTTIDETVALLKQGRRELLPHLRCQLQQSPDFWKHYGDAGRITQSAWVRQIAGDDDLVRESLYLMADENRRSLVGEDATPAERLLAERVVLAQLQLAYFEQLEGQNAMNLLDSSLGSAVQKRLQSANHQLNESISQLQRVRKLGAEIQPRRPAAALKLYDPDRKKRKVG